MNEQDYGKLVQFLAKKAPIHGTEEENVQAIRHTVERMQPSKELQEESVLFMTERMIRTRSWFSGQIDMLRYLYGEEFANKVREDAIELQKYLVAND